MFNKNELRAGMGLQLALIIVAIALAGSGVSYYSIKQHAREARKAQDKALADGDAKLQEHRMQRGEMMRHKVLTVKLAAQNNSGQSGEAMIEDAGGKAKVTLKLENSPKDTPQPAHIHLGACPSPGAVKYPLSNLVNGNFVTQLEVTVEEILAGLPLAVNVHKSASDAKTYVACGDIKNDDSMMDKGDAMKSDSGMMKDDSMMGDSMMGGTKQVVISAENFAFSQKEIRVKKGDKVKLTLQITGGFHDLALDEFGVKTKQMSTGGSETVEFTADKTGTFEYYCSVGKHRQMGMVGKLVVE